MVRGAPPSPEELFARYRRRGDVRALALLFDTAAPELFPLALRLSEDAASAEDALQDTWLAAIEAEGEVRSVMPWLVGILKNKVKRIRRTGQRMPAVGAPAAELLGEEPADAAQREEALRAVRSALDDLPETYREVAVLRWRYGLDPAEIADARGIPPGTVRSLLSRAAEKLRTRLGALSIVAGIPTLRGLLEIRNAVLAKVGAGAATTAALVTGALVMSKKIGIAVVVVLALAAGLVTLSDRDTGTSPPPDAPGPETVATGTALEAAEGDPEAENISSASIGDPLGPDASEREAGTGTARVIVTWSDGTPAAGVFVRVFAWDGPDPFNRVLEVRTGIDGRAIAGGLAPGRITAYLDRGGSETSLIEAGGSVELAMKLKEGTEVTGVVVGQDGIPVERADIWLSEYGNTNNGRIVSRSGPGGAFRIRSVQRAHYVGARAAGHSPSGLSRVSGSDGDRVELRLVLPAGGCVVEGVVVSAGGDPVSHARVRVGPVGFRNVILEDGTTVPASPALEVRTDARGAFRVEGVPPGAVLVGIRALGQAPGREEIELEPGGLATMEIVLPAGVTVTGVVTDAAGVTVPGAGIFTGEYAGFFSSRVRSRPDGSFRFDGLASGKIEIGALKKGIGKDRRIFQVVPGQELVWNPVLTTKDGVRGTVVSGAGTPRVGWLVTASERTRSTAWRGQAKTGADGGFEIPDCPQSPLRLEVYAPDGRRHCLLPSATVLDPVVGGDPLRIVVENEALPSAFVIGELVDPEGRPVGGANVSIRCIDTGFAPRNTTEKDTGRFRIGPLPRGAYTLDVHAKGWPRLKLGERVLSTDETLDLGRIELLVGAEVVARIVRSDGEPVGDGAAFCELIDARRTGTIYIAAVEGVLRSGPVAPGRYVLRVEAMSRKGTELALVPIRIRAGEDVEIDVTLEHAPRMAVQVYFPEGAPESAKTRLLIRDENRVLVRDSRVFAISSISLLPGRYTVEATTTSGLRAEANIDVAPLGGGAEPDPIVLRLR